MTEMWFNTSTYTSSTDSTNWNYITMTILETRELPDWAKEMSDEQWLKQTQKAKTYKSCATCNKRLIMVLCKHTEPKHYCYEHCPEHKWQSDYDWRTECACCGIGYTEYLEFVLRLHNIPFKKAR